MSNKRISELTTSSTPLTNSDYIEVSVYNGATYDSKKLSKDYLSGAKTYKCLVSQASTSNPSLFYVAVNTLGSVSASRVSTGYYTIDTSSLFTSGQTFVHQIPSTIQGSEIIIDIHNTSQIRIYTYVGGVLTDSVLTNVPLTIEVY